MISNDNTIIELSKRKILYVLLMACAFVALGAWLFSLDAATIRSLNRFNNPVIVHGAGLISIVFFGLCGIYALKMVFDKKPGLVLNNSGIIDNASSLSAGLIPWSDVVGSEIFEVQKQKMLIVKVRNPQKYINRGNWLRKTMTKSTYKMCGSPISISSNTLNITFPELILLFKKYQHKYGNNRATT